MGSGYHQIKLGTTIARRQQSSRNFLLTIEKTVFRTRYGLYKFDGPPFGLTNPLKTYMNTMNHVLHEYLDQFCGAYLDESLLYNQTWEEHQRHLQLIFDKLQQHQLYVLIEKCELRCRALEFLGPNVSSQGINVLQTKTQSIQTWPIPHVVSELRSFLGMMNYYRKFIQGYFAISKPLI